MHKTQVPGIYKKSEGILVNADNDALIQYKKKRDNIRLEKNRINTIESKVDLLTKDIEEIKLLLRKLTKE